MTNKNHAPFLDHQPPKIYRLAKRLAYFSLKPLYLAESERRLFNAGYVLFGLQLAFLLLFLWLCNPFGAWDYLADTIPHILGLVLWVVGKSDPPEWVANTLFDALILYVLASFVPPLRRTLGKGATMIALEFTKILITLGEKLLKYRTVALLCTLGLLISFTLGLTALYFVYKERSDIQQAYDAWLFETERFISRATLVRQERVLYAPVSQVWEVMSKKGFEMSADHPARILHLALRDLYREPLSDSNLWMSRLREVSRSINSLQSVQKALEEVPTSANREWSALFAFLGRSYMRSVGDECEDSDKLRSAYSFYGAMTSRELARSKLNGLGTIHACRLVSYLRAVRSNKSTDVGDWGAVVCSSLRDCLEEARLKYSAAAEDSERCEFLDKRRRNNELDLYLKLGLYFDEARSVLNTPPYAQQVASPEGFVEALNGQLEKLLECWEGDFVPGMFLSAAQANGVIAAVLRDHSAARAAAMSNAAHYLRLSIAWLPGVTLESDFTYFCTVLDSDGELEEPFVKTFQETLPGLDVDFILIARSIQRACGGRQ